MLKITFILVFSLDLLSNATSESKSCKVPNIKNGEFGRYTSNVNFEKVGELEIIKDEEILTLRCLKGYAPDPRLNNNPINGFFEEEVTCGDGVWSKNVSCRSISCCKPPRIKNGYPTVGNATHPERNHGAVVTYSCRGNRMLVDKGKVECYFGKWIGEPADCMDNCNTNDLKNYAGLEIERGIVYKHSETLHIHCLQGYVTSSPENVIACQNGKWELSADPPCIENLCYIPEVKNGEMGHFETRYSTNNYAGFKKFFIGQRVNQNETVYLRCEDGYFPVEGSSIYYSNQLEIRCEDRTWSKVVQCKAAPCLGKPPKIDNGEPVTSSREHGYVMRYTCNDNVTTMIGNVTCHFGSWIGNTPICPDSRCYKKDLYPYKGLKLPEKEFFLHLESFKVECAKEYNFSTPEGNVTCLNGTWIIAEDSCKEKARCEQPLVPDHGSVKLLGEPKIGSLAIYTCDPDRMLLGASTTKCLISGQWTFDPPKCLRFCDVPLIENGEMGQFEMRDISRWKQQEEFKKFFEGDRVKSNETLFFRCKNGFLPNEDLEFFESNRVEMTCNDGTWSKRLQCKKTSCDGNPPDIENGMAVITGRTHGYTIWYKCDNQRYTKVAGQVTCMFGSWMGKAPKCLDSPCFTKEINHAGLRKPSEKLLSSGQSFDIVCEYGFEKSVSATKVTCNEGKWSITQNPCINATNCSIQNLTMSVPEGVVLDTTLVTKKFMPLGSEFQLKCEDNLIIDGNSKAICGSFGKWQLGSFRCVPGCLLKVDSSSHIMIEPLKDSYRFGEFVLLSCPPGEEISNDVERLMCIGEAWSQPIPDCKVFK